MSTEQAPKFDSSVVGFIGLGVMGAFTIGHLLNKGYTVMVYDIDASKVEEMVKMGCKEASSVADVASKCTCVVCMVPGPSHSKKVFMGPDGVFANLKNKGTYCVDCSTIGYHTAADLAQAAKEVGQIYLDTPMSGGSFGAKNGTLTFMVGASEGEFSEVYPFFMSFGKNCVHTGTYGSGQLNKVVNNMLLAMHMVSLSEAYTMATMLKADLHTLNKVLSTSTGNSACVYAYNPLPGLTPDSPSNNNYEAGFSIDLLLKDVGIALDMAKEIGKEMPMLKLAQSQFQAAKAAGYAHLDMTAVIKLYDESF